MDVRDLAPALLAVGQLFEAANKVLHGENSSARIRIRTVSPGSFAVGLDVGVSFLTSLRDMLSGTDATAAANLITLLTFGISIPIGAIRLTKLLGGKRPTAISRLPEGLAVVEINGQKIEVDEPVVRLALDVNVRLALERVIAEPLAKEGIDVVEIEGGGHSERIEKSEAYFFLMPPDREAGVFESRYRGPFSIVNLSFKEGNKWRLHDGNSALNATVIDQSFLDRVNRNEVSFSKGDILICDVKVITRQEPKGLKAEYFIERVIEHRRETNRQSSLFELEDGEDAQHQEVGRATED